MNKQKFSIQFSSNKKINFLIITLLVSIALAGIILLIPAVQNVVINLAETFLHRALQDHGKWHRLMTKGAIILLISEILFSFILIYKKQIYTLLFPKFDRAAPSIFSFNFFAHNKSFAANNFFYIAISAIFTLLVTLQIFWISQKQGFMVDEPLSISICNRNEYGFWGKNYEAGKEFSGLEVKNISLWDNDSVLDAVSDVAHLWVNNRDNPHTNFYYSLLRIWFIANSNNDLRYIFWRGCLLNVLFFALAFYFMLLILGRVTQNEILFLIAIIATFANKLYITNILMLRPYALQATCLIIFSYIFICYFDALKNGQTVFSRKDFFVSAILTSLAMLSGYFSLIYICLLGLVILVFATNKKSFDIAKYFIFLLITSLVFAKILYLDFFGGVIGYRGEEAFAKFNITSIAQDLTNTIKLFSQMIFANYISTQSLAIIFILLFIFSIIFYSKNRNVQILVSKNIVATVCVLWSVLVLYFSPLLSVRHIAPIAPLFVLFIVQEKPPKKFLVTNTAICILSICFLSLKIIPTAENINSMPYLQNYSQDAGFLKDTSVPVVIHGKINWEYASLVPYLHDEPQKYFFVDTTEDFENLNLGKNAFWLVEQTSAENKIAISEKYKAGEPRQKQIFSYWEETLMELQ